MGSNKKIKVTYICNIIFITTYQNTYIHHCVVKNITTEGPTISYTIHSYTLKHTTVFSYMQLNPHISTIHKVVFLTAANILLQI